MVDYIYDDIDASKFLKYRDQILSINNSNYSQVTQKEWCKIMQNGLFNNLETDKIKIKVLRNGKELEFILEKAKLL